MRSMKFVVSAALALAVLLPVLGAGDRASALRPKLPPAGNCKAMAAAGQKNIWYGEYSGRYESLANDRVYPLAARGCFRSERACRRWINEVASLSQSSGLMRCTPYR